MSAPKERPILFSGPMVRAILEGRKTQTRRLIRPEWFRCLDPEDADDMPSILAQCPYGVPGDRLWVRETWGASRDLDGSVVTIYQADGTSRVHGTTAAPIRSTAGPAVAKLLPDRWCPSIHMPRALSRITLEVTATRVERLQDISEEDARAEGVTLHGSTHTWSPVRSIGTFSLEKCDCGATRTLPPFGPRLYTEAMAGIGQEREPPHCHRLAFRQLWNAINGKRASWASNPWVWAVTFKMAS